MKVCSAPFQSVQFLLYTAEVVASDDEVAGQAGLFLQLQRRFVVVPRLLIVTDTAVKTRNTVDRIAHLLWKIELLVQFLRPLQVGETCSEPALHAAQVATQEQRIGEQFTLTVLFGDRD